MRRLLGLFPVLMAATVSLGVAPLLFLTNVLSPLSQGGRTAVAFRFTAIGGSWQIDDVYVDPFKDR